MGYIPYPAEAIYRNGQLKISQLLLVLIGGTQSVVPKNHRCDYGLEGLVVLGRLRFSYRTK